MLTRRVCFENSALSTEHHMTAVIDFIQQQITPDIVNNISTDIGEDPAKTRQAIDASIPLLAGAMSTQVPDPTNTAADSGTQRAMLGGLGDMISGAAETGNTGGLGGLGGALGGMLGGAGAGGEGILDSILGGSQSTVQDDVAKASGIAPQKVMRVLTMLVPIVIAAYTRQRKAEGGPTRPATEGGGGLLGDIIDRVT